MFQKVNKTIAISECLCDTISRKWKNEQKY